MLCGGSLKVYATGKRRGRLFNSGSNPGSSSKKNYKMNNYPQGRVSTSAINQEIAEIERLQIALADTVQELSITKQEKANIERGCGHYFETSEKWKSNYRNLSAKRDLQIFTALIAGVCIGCAICAVLYFTFK